MLPTTMIPTNKKLPNWLQNSTFRSTPKKWLLTFNKLLIGSIPFLLLKRIFIVLYCKCWLWINVRILRKRSSKYSRWRKCTQERWSISLLKFLILLSVPINETGKRLRRRKRYTRWEVHSSKFIKSCWFKVSNPDISIDNDFMPKVSRICYKNKEVIIYYFPQNY